MKKLNIPPSKSISNRDLILAALAEGKTQLSGVLDSDDTGVMIEALQKLGIAIEDKGDGNLLIDGGIKNIKKQSEVILNLKDSGTSVRFLTGLAVLFTNKINKVIITGSKRTQQRPINDLSEGLKQIGVDIQTNNGCPPVLIQKGNIEAYGSKIIMNGEKSSQFFTSLLQIAPILPNGLEIEAVGKSVSKSYIGITIDEQEKFGVKVVNNNYKTFAVEKQAYKPVDICIEGDASAMSYIAAYIFLHGGELQIENIGEDTKQGDYKFLDILKPFGLQHNSEKGTTTIKAKGLKEEGVDKHTNLELDFSEMPDVSLTFMALAVLFPGKTKLIGLQTLNLKECKRIDAMAAEIQKLGIDVQYDKESMSIGELDISREREEVNIETYNDHRIAMSFAILNSYIGGMNILDKPCVNKTYPNFWKDLEFLKTINT